LPSGANVSHAHPLPKTPAAAFENCSWNLLKLPSCASMSFASSPLGASPPPFDRICHQNE